MDVHYSLVTLNTCTVNVVFINTNLDFINIILQLLQYHIFTAYSNIKDILLCMNLYFF